tara:strand:- start:14 stop:484 length:471 start_codon:yes stop_codon:yes gene_type:complete
MAITKKAANAKYDKLRAQLKKGDISKEAFKAAANRIYKMYHGDANKATRNAPKAKPSPKAKPVAKAKPKVSNQSNKDGTYGKSLPSNPKLKSNTNRRHSLMTKGVMVGEDVKPRKKQSPRAGSRANPGRKALSLKFGKAPGSTASKRRAQRRRRRP